VGVEAQGQRSRTDLSPKNRESSRGFTVRDCFTHWLEIKDQTRSGKTLDRYRQVVRDFLSSLGERADAWIHHITSQDILAYRTHIRKTGRTSRTANLSVTVISAGFRAALRERKIDANPCVPVNGTEKLLTRKTCPQSERPIIIFLLLDAGDSGHRR
jgi:site-specific recombinase XerD